MANAVFSLLLLLQLLTLGVETSSHVGKIRLVHDVVAAKDAACAPAAHPHDHVFVDAKTPHVSGSGAAQVMQ